MKRTLKNDPSSGKSKLSPLGVSPSLDLGLLQSFIEALPDACVVVDRAGDVLAVNTAWNELTHQNTASANATGSPLGISYLSLCRSTSTEKGLNEVRAGLEAVLSGKSKQFERDYLVRAPGVFHWYRKIVRPFRQFGAQAIIFHREITREKLDKAHPESLDGEFRLLADSAPVLIWMSGPDRACTFFNRQWLEFTGVPLEEQLGEGWLKLVHADDREGISRAYRGAFNHKREFEYEYRLRCRDGSYRWIRDHGLPRFDLHHHIIGFIGSAWDLSDQKQATEAAYKATRQTRLEHIVAVIANSATTLREALQRTLDAVCEMMEFPVGHALLIYDDEPELAKPAHILHLPAPP